MPPLIQRPGHLLWGCGEASRPRLQLPAESSSRPRHQVSCFCSCDGSKGSPRRGQCQLRAVIGRQLEQCLGRIVPRMQREIERRPVNRQQWTATQQRVSRQCILWPEVDVAPCRMERTDLQHHQVEGSEALLDLRVFIGESGVTTEEDPVLLRLDDERRPRSAIAIGQPASEKCCEGAAVSVRPVLATRCDSHQSSSTMRSGAMPKCSRCVPTPSDVMMGTDIFRICRMVL